MGKGMWELPFLGGWSEYRRKAIVIYPLFFSDIYELSRGDRSSNPVDRCPHLQKVIPCIKLTSFLADVVKWAWRMGYAATLEVVPLGQYLSTSVEKPVPLLPML